MPDMEEKLLTKAITIKEGDKLIAVASEEVEDREGEVLSIDGWKLDNFKKNPVLLWGHNANEPAVGRAENIRKKVIDGKKKLVFEPVFHGLSKKSQLLEKLYKTGFLNSFSVGFLPLEKEGNKYTKQELLEISAVNVPALPSAMVQARMKKYGITEKDLEILNTKPYPSEHSCDFGGDFEEYRRKNCEQKSNGKCIDVVYGIKDGKAKISSLRYKKDIWDAGEARAHCEERGGKFVPATGTAETETEKIKRVLPFKPYTKAPEDAEWDAGAEVKKADVKDLKEMCAWVGDDPENKTSYKLPHHRVSDYAVVWRGVAAAMAALLGARGGTNIPEKDRRGVYNHLAKHYKQFDKEVPEFKELNPPNSPKDECNTCSGGDEGVAQNEDEKGVKVDKVKRGETIDLLKVAFKALEVGFQKPKKIRRASHIAYRALELALSYNKKNGKRRS